MKTTLTDEQINEIAENFECGLQCHWKRETNELKFLPDIDLIDDLEGWEDDIKALEENEADWELIDPPPSNYAFEIMADFADSLPENLPLKRVLLNALNRKIPFGNFKFEIDNSGPYRDQWFAFRREALCDWVRKQTREVDDWEDEE